MQYLKKAQAILFLFISYNFFLETENVEIIRHFDTYYNSLNLIQGTKTSEIIIYIVN